MAKFDAEWALAVQAARGRRIAVMAKISLTRCVEIYP
jgi:hypothetical protein